MTVSSSVNKVIYSGNSATVLFPVSYYFLENSHLRVILRAADGTETVQALTTNYTVTGAGNPAGGSVTMLVAPPTGTTLTIVRNVPATQETDYLANDPFPAESHERALDKLTMLVQENEEVASRALVVPASTPTTVNTTLPNPSPLGILAWNQNANAINYISPSDIGTAVAYATAYADTFDCDGVDQTFTLTANPAVINNLDVSINGSTQVPNVDYTLSGTTLTMTTPPPVNSVLLVKYKEGLPNYEGDSQDVRYVPAGTGAVATTVQAKLRQTISVEDFGADPTGLTDSSAAIQSAIDASISSGVLSFAGGSYLLNTEITINKPLTVNLNGSTITSSADNIFTITSSGVFINGDFAQITHTGVGVAVRTNPPSATNYTNVEIIRTSISGSAGGAGGILFRNVHYGRVDAFLTGYSAGYGLTIEGHPTGHPNDYAMRCVVEGTTRIENHLYGIVLGGINGPANANEIHARVTTCAVGITWLTGRPNYISNANIEFCPTGIDGGTHTPDGVLTVIGCNFENNTTDIVNANSANTRIAVYQSDIFSVSDPGQRMVISNAGAASGANTSLRIQQWGEGFRYIAPPFSVVPTSTFSGDLYVNTISGTGGSLFVKSGLGYSSGAGIAATQTGSRTTNVNAAAPCGSITLFSAAGSTSWTSFSVLTSFVSATDTVIVSQKSGTDKYRIHVTEVVDGAFQVTFATTGGTTVETPVFNFSVIQSVAS